MKRFRDFLEERHPATWHASKDQIIDLWKNLKPSPILMQPIPENQKGTRLGNDGLRITGSASFINSVLSRIKDVLEYEKNPGTRLDIEYRQIETKGQNQPQRYLCYIHVEQDMKKKQQNKFTPEIAEPKKATKVKLATTPPMTPPTV